MRQLETGETFIVTRNGTPVGELTPFRRHRFVSAHSASEMFRGAPTVDLARMRADLGAFVDQDPGPHA